MREAVRADASGKCHGCKLQAYRYHQKRNMTTAEARLAIGQLVTSYDPDHKLIRRVRTPHGPYRLKAVTKGGLAILSGRDDGRIPTSLLIMKYNYLALIQGGIEPDVWDEVVPISAVDFRDAANQAISKAEDLGGRVVMMEQSE